MKHLALITIFTICQLTYYAQSKAFTQVGDTLYHYYYLGEIRGSGKFKHVPDSEYVISGYSIEMEMNPNRHFDVIHHIFTDGKMAEAESFDTTVVSDNQGGRVEQNLTFRDGVYREWYMSGVLRVECTYHRNKLNGVYKSYHHNGVIKRKEDWNMGEMIRGECFDEQGNVKEYCSFKKQPEFPGGQIAFSSFITKNLKYPNSALARNIQGVVYIKYTVDVDGSVINPKILKGVHKSLDNEAIRLVKKMPDWKPGMLEGKPVKVHYTLPLNFQF